MKGKIKFNFYNDRRKPVVVRVKGKGPGRGWWGPPKGTHAKGEPGKKGAVVPSAVPFGATVVHVAPISSLGMDEDYEISRHSELAAEIAYDLDLDAEIIAEDLTDWAIDSQSRAGLIYQIAASQEFGAALSSYARNEADKLGISKTADFSDERRVLRYIYENSRQRVGDGMVLYRGSVHRESNSLESWTTDPRIAAFYVRREGSGDVFKKFFPAKQILGTYHIGLGLESAKEVVVIN